jgi:hypothetical protein
MPPCAQMYGELESALPAVMLKGPQDGDGHILGAGRKLCVGGFVPKTENGHLSGVGCPVKSRDNTECFIREHP